MTRNRLRGSVLALAVVPAVILAQTTPQRPTFQTGVDIVTIDATVHEGNLAVKGLRPEDFDVTDNGVPQKVDEVSGDSLPIDMTIVIDASGSVQSMMSQLQKDAAEAAAMLRPDDRMRIMAFTSDVVQLTPFQPAGDELRFEHAPMTGMTSIFDALTAALMRTRTPDRHELIVLFTDGMDTSSIIGRDMAVDVAKRSDAILHTFIVHMTPGPTVPTGPPPLPPALQVTGGGWMPFTHHLFDGDMDVTAIKDASDVTGGELQHIFGENHVPRGLKTAIDDMRTSYILRYTATGVTRTGWHEVKIKITKPGDYNVRARKGYYGGIK